MSSLSHLSSLPGPPFCVCFFQPYAQKYHEPGTKDYDAPLFLDCCGLVRRAMDDLQEVMIVAIRTLSTQQWGGGADRKEKISSIVRVSYPLYTGVWVSQWAMEPGLHV